MPPKILSDMSLVHRQYAINSSGRTSDGSKIWTR